MRKLFWFFVAVVLFTSCKNTLDSKVNAENFVKVKEFINKSDTIKELKKQYLIDKMSEDVAANELGKIMTKKDVIDKKFIDLYKEYSNDYLQKEKIFKFITLTNCYAVPISEYVGYLFFNLKFNNQFHKDVLYINLNYKYVDAYDQEGFNETTIVKDIVADNFKKETKLSASETYNSVAKFMYSKLPEDTLKNKPILMAGLKTVATLIVFKDKSKVELPESEFKYFKK